LYLTGKHLLASAACSGDSFTFLHVGDLCTSQENIYELPRPVTEIALLFYMKMMFVPHRKHTYELPRPLTGMAGSDAMEYAHGTVCYMFGVIMISLESLHYIPGGHVFILDEIIEEWMLRRVTLVGADFSEELSAKYFFAACVGCWLQLALFLVHRFLSP
jgi:hypothetical protein